MSLPRPVRAVIFDMDGLLVDTETVYAKAMIATATAMGRDLDLEVIKRMIGHAWAASGLILIEHMGEGFDAEAFRIAAVERFYQLIEAEVALKAGVIELLDHLDAMGLPRAIATSSRRSEVEHHIGAHGLLDRFHAILAAGEYPRAKPHPDPYLLAAEALGVSPPIASPWRTATTACAPRARPA